MNMNIIAKAVAVAVSVVMLTGCAGGGAQGTAGVGKGSAYTPVVDGVQVKLFPTSL